MKILFTYSVVGLGGDAIQTLAIANALCSIGHEVALVGPNPVRPYDVNAPMFGLPTWVFQKLPRGLIDFVVDYCLQFATLWRARHLTRAQHFDLVFHRAHIYDLIGGSIAQFAHSPLVVILDAPHGEEWAMIGKSYNQRMHRFAMQRVIHKASLLVTVSQFSKRYFLNFGVSPEKILVQPNGISNSQLERGAFALREFPPFRRQDITTVGFVGSFTPWHRVDILLEALKRLELRGRNNYKAILVGTGSKYYEWRSLAERLKLQSYINWFGALPHVEAFKQIEKFDIAILPHTLHTGTPMKLLEYGATGRPIMAPNLPNIRDIFEHGKDIWLFEPGNATAIADGLQTLCQQPHYARELGRNALEKIRNFTWEANVSQILTRVL